MKQGRATHSGTGATKVEPMSKAVGPGPVSRIGLAQGTHITDNRELPLRSNQLYHGRGLEAPKATCKTKDSGSQGRY